MSARCQRRLPWLVRWFGAASIIAVCAKRDINLAEYIGMLRELNQQSNTPVQEENCPKEPTIARKKRRKKSK